MKFTWLVLGLCSTQYLFAGQQKNLSSKLKEGIVLDLGFQNTKPGEVRISDTQLLQSRSQYEELYNDVSHSFIESIINRNLGLKTSDVARSSEDSSP